MIGDEIGPHGTVCSDKQGAAECSTSAMASLRCSTIRSRAVPVRARIGQAGELRPRLR